MPKESQAVWGTIQKVTPPRSREPAAISAPDIRSWWERGAQGDRLTQEKASREGGSIFPAVAPVAVCSGDFFINAVSYGLPQKWGFRCCVFWVLPHVAVSDLYEASPIQEGSSWMLFRQELHEWSPFTFGSLWQLWKEPTILQHCDASLISFW